MIPCDCCNTFRQFGELTRNQYDPACRWCGARYFRSLQGWPRLEGETKEKRRAWQQQVLDTWAAQGHDRAELRTMAMEGPVPLAPAQERRKQK